MESGFIVLVILLLVLSIIPTIFVISWALSRSKEEKITKNGTANGIDSLITLEEALSKPMQTHKSYLTVTLLFIIICIT